MLIRRADVDESARCRPEESEVQVAGRLCMFSLMFTTTAREEMIDEWDKTTGRLDPKIPNQELRLSEKLKYE